MKLEDAEQVRTLLAEMKYLGVVLKDLNTPPVAGGAAPRLVAKFPKLPGNPYGEHEVPMGPCDRDMVELAIHAEGADILRKLRALGVQLE
jgi:hypothetical protein